MRDRIEQWRDRWNERVRKFRKQARGRWEVFPTLGTARVVLLALGMFILVAMVYLAQSSNAAIIARDLRVKQLKIEEVKRENAQLRYEIAALASPSAIEQRARKLGLGAAKHIVYADMPWIEPTTKELMPAFLTQGQEVTAPETFQSSPDTLHQLLALFGLDNLSDSASAQTK